VRGWLLVSRLLAISRACLCIRHVWYAARKTNASRHAHALQARCYQPARFRRLEPALLRLYSAVHVMSNGDPAYTRAAPYLLTPGDHWVLGHHRVLDNPRARAALCALTTACHLPELDCTVLAFCIAPSGF